MSGLLAVQAVDLSSSNTTLVIVVGVIAVLAVALGIAIGAVVTSAVRTTATPVETERSVPVAQPVTTVATPEEGVLLVWVPGGLPAWRHSPQI